MHGRFGELLLIFMIILLLFGSKRIPIIMRDIGRGLHNLREGARSKTPSDKD